MQVRIENPRRSPRPCRRAARVPLMAFGALLLFASITSADLQSPADDLVSVTQLRAKYRSHMLALAEACRQCGLPEQAKITREALGPDAEYRIVLPVLPRAIGPPSIPPDAADPVRAWHGEFWKTRREYAGALWSLAQRLVRTRPSLAYSLGVEVASADPDHEGARKLLGYRRYRDWWCTPLEIRNIVAGKVLHEKFGWLPREHVEKYEAGMRLVGGNWVRASQDNAIHGSVMHGRRHLTEHYEIRTNLPLEHAVMLGQRLERFHQMWTQIFIRYYATEAVVAGLFQGGALETGGAQRLEIVCFRNKDDYVKTLKPIEPNIEVSCGIYLGRTGTVYTFAGDEHDVANLYHEATHQLFDRIKRTSPMVGKQRNFWIAEGAAMLMESLRAEDGYYVIGGVDCPRLRAARYRMFSEDKFHVPIDQLVQYGERDITSHPRIAALYSEMGGLAHFLAFYQDGRYRDAMVAYLTALYAGTDRENTLTELTGQSYDELETRYKAFLKETLLIAQPIE